MNGVGIWGSGVGVRGATRHKMLVGAAVVMIAWLFALVSVFELASTVRALERTRVDPGSTWGRASALPAEDVTGKAVLVPDLDVQRLAFCPGGRELAVVTRQGKMFLVDWPAGTARPYEPPPQKTNLPPCAARSAGSSPEGGWYAAATGDTVSIFDGTSGAMMRRLQGHLGGINAVGVSPDGSRLVSVGADNDVRIWDAHTGECLTTITTLTHGAFAVVWAPNGRTFYTAGASRTVSEWDATTGQRLRESAPVHHPIGEAALSPDGRHLAIGTFDATGFDRPAEVSVLSVVSFAEERVITSPKGGAVAVTFAPDGRAVLWAASTSQGITVSPIE
jgi:Tol biopolymer transport system component